MTKTKYGLQMYSVRDVAEVSLEKALKEVAKLGYKYIEFAGFFDNKAEDVKMWLDNLSLTCSGTHTGIQALLPETIDETIRYHKAIGCDNIIIPGLDITSKEKIEENIKNVNYAQKKLKEHGIKLGFHNHSKEFFPTTDGTLFEDEIIERTNVELEIDTFWLFNAGVDVISYLEAHKDRICVIHIKDGIPSEADKKNINEAHVGVKGLSLGLGKAPVKAVSEWAKKNNVLMVVESENLEPNGIEEVKRCIEYLRTLD